MTYCTLYEIFSDPGPSSRPTIGYLNQDFPHPPDRASTFRPDSEDICEEQRTSDLKKRVERSNGATKNKVGK